MDRLDELIESVDKAFNASPDFVYIFNDKNVCLYANESGANVYGLPKSEIIGKKWNELNPSPQISKSFEKRIGEVFSTGRPVTTEVHTETVSGVEDFRYTLTPVSENGTVGVVVALARDITERKVTERSLKESERRFRELFEKAGLVAVIVDNQGKTVFINDYTLNLLGRNRGEVLGKPYIEFVAPEQREQVANAFMQAIMTGHILSQYKSDIMTVWGERRTIFFTNVILRDAKGNVVGTANMGQDVTEEERAAKEISESRKQVLDILESITDGFFALDNLWRFTYVNKRAAELIGRRREDLLFKNMWEVMPELAGTRFEVEYSRAKEDMTPVSFEEFYSPLNRWFAVHVYPYEHGLSVYLEDITKRKRLEKEREHLLAQIKNLTKNV